MVVELQGQTLDTFSNLTRKTTKKTRIYQINSNIIIEAINNMNRNTNTDISRNRNNLETLPRNTEKFDANVQVELQKRKRLHYQIY